MSKQQKTRRILMTSALPYANGPIHLGHLVEAIQADIWRRWQILNGQECHYVCGTDAHGTPVMLLAQQRGITPEQLCIEMMALHQQDYKGFLVEFDSFYTTHSPENRTLAELIYQRLQANGDIETRTVSQAFDEEKQLFLADRFIRGTCPRCRTENQCGDNCEACGATYSPMELINPVSALSGSPPIVKDTERYFFNIENYHQLLEEWISSDHLPPPIVNKLREWFADPLKPWDITRDAPYFGFEIPGAANKFFYVWMDAPIGYMASTQKLCEARPELRFDDFWQKDAEQNSELFHFVGKDVIYFHALFWPAMLKGANFRLPTQIFVHGFLTINGAKMSKSRGTFITAQDYLKHLNPEYLRYYFAAKLAGPAEDIDLNLEDFRLRINSDLVGKFVNLASRCAGFVTQSFGGQLAEALPDPELFAEFVAAGEIIGESYENLNYNRVVREIMSLADRANQYIDQKQPWALVKQPGRQAETHAICTQGLNLFRLMALYLKPILPNTAEKVERFLNIKPLTWEDRVKPLVNHPIFPFSPLMQRIPEEITETLKPAVT